MLLYREKICRDIYTNVIDKFDVISWLFTLYMLYGADLGHIFFTLKQVFICFYSAVRRVLVIPLVICTSKNIQLCFDSC